MSVREEILANLRRNISPARARVESVLLHLREFPLGVDRAPIAARIEAAIVALDRLSDLDPERVEFFPTLDDAQREINEALTLLEPLGGSTPVVRSRSRLEATQTRLGKLREASIDALVALEDRRMRAGPEGAALATAEPFRASIGVPAIHAVLRASPHIQLELYPTPEHEELDDSEDVPDEPPRPPPPAPLSPEETLLVDHARAMARDCLHEMATLSGLRAPLPESPWTHGEPFERRLLASLDALHALAFEPHGVPEAFSIFEEVQRYAREAPTVDPGREFARALSFACARGEGALRGVALALRQTHRMTIPAQRDAFCLARHPSTADVARELLGEQDPLLLHFAIEVLRFCRAARIPDLAPLAGHPDAGVRAAALLSLGFVPEREAATELLLDALMEEGDEEPLAALAAAEALVRLGRVEGLAFARERLDATYAEPDSPWRTGAMRLVALTGGEVDASRLARAFGIAPREALWLGFFGHPAVVPALLEALASANQVRRSTGPWVHPLEIAVAEALVRITGFVPKDEPSEVNDYDFTSRPTIFAETWTRLWQERQGLYPASAKLRFGRPFSPAATIEELLGPSLVEVRDDLALELAVCLGETTFEPGDWVARQRATLAATSELSSKDGFAPGTFLATRLGRRTQNS